MVAVYREDVLGLGIQLQRSLVCLVSPLGEILNALNCFQGWEGLEFAMTFRVTIERNLGDLPLFRLLANADSDNILRYPKPPSVNLILYKTGQSRFG